MLQPKPLDVRPYLWTLGPSCTEHGKGGRVGDDVRFWEAAALVALHAQMQRGARHDVAVQAAASAADGLCVLRKQKAEQARKAEELEERARRS